MNILRNIIFYKYSIIPIILILITNSCKLFCPEDETEEPQTQRIAFLRDRDTTNSVYINDDDLWIMDMDGSNQTQLTFGIDDIGDFVFSPDGQKICFITYYDYNNSDIYIMNADGSNLINLTNDDKYHQLAVFTQDSKQLIFNTELSQSDLFIMNIDGSNLTNITNTDSIWEIYPVFIPNENRILYRYTDINATNQYQLYTMNLYGNDSKCVTCQYGYLQPKHHQVTSDGMKILFLSTWPIIYIDSTIYEPLYIVNNDGSDLEMIYYFEAQANIYDIQLAPNDNYILYRIDEDFYRINIDGTDNKQLTQDYIDTFAADFSYDGAYITFTSCERLFCKIYLMGADGNNQKFITKGSRSKFQPKL